MKIKYRILEKVIDGENYFYPQVKLFKFFPWQTIKTRGDKLFQVSGKTISLYYAKIKIKNHKKAVKFGVKIHKL